MIYPSVGQYTEAIKLAEQSPEDYFATLTTLRPVLDADNNPVMSSGNFAVVFKMVDQTDGKFYALKCFTRDQEGRDESYRLIADELQDVSSDYITKIQYLDKELFVDTNTDDNEFPVLLMDWVEGETLDKYINKHIKEPACLNLLVGRFGLFADWLLKQPFAHGDLKPDNILVKDDGTLVAVDYDGMFVPKMRGQKARELGSPDFRHPQRTEDDFDEHIDDFAIVTLLLTIKAIALNPSLNTKDCVLLHTQDFSNIAQSTVNQKLQELIGDSDFARLYAVFVVVLAEKKIEGEVKNLFSSVKEKVDIDELEYQYLVHLWEKCHNLDKSEQILEIIYSIANKLSDKGHTKAMYFLGICYFWGFGGAEQNYDRAFNLYRKSANDGFSRASFNLGYCYDIGEVDEQPQPYQALKWYLKSAEQGEPIAMCSLGQLYEYALNDIENAVECYKKAVAADIVSAYYYLGLCYKYGKGISIDYAKAVELFETVITSNEVTLIQSWYGSTYYEIGHCYYYGLGVEENIDKAISFFQEADFWGNDTAKFALDCIFQNSYFDEYKQCQVFNKISNSNYWKNYTNLVENSDNSKNKSTQRKPFDYYRALVIIKKAAHNGVLEAQFRYGRCLENGFGMEQNFELADDWYTKAANNGNVKAMVRLASLYEGVDNEKAIEWYQRAIICYTITAEQGNPDSQYKLGSLYDCGDYYGANSDYNKAVEWYTKAAEQGYAKAQNALGACYEQGNGVEQNNTKAVEWYTKAAEQGNAWAQNNLNKLINYEKNIK